MRSETIAADIDAKPKAGRLRTLIIGAGVAGLTLAALMRQRGETPVIIEREDTLRNQGYMLGLYPLGGRVLQGLNLHDRYLSRSVPMYHYNIGNSRGKLVREYSLERVAQRYGAIQGISRGELVELLLEGIKDVPVHLGRTVTDLKQHGAEVEVTFSDGSLRCFDLVVAADGLYSDTRKLVFNRSEYIYRDTGWGGWVFWADAGLALPDTYTEYWGASYFLGLYPVKHRLGVFIGGPTDKVQRLGFETFAEQLRETFGQCVPALPSNLETPTDSFFWKFHDCRSKHWRQGRIIFLGNAAVGFLPTAGIGASVAMESAAALNDELSRTDAEHVEQALALYEKRRRRRVEKAQTSSRRLGKMMFIKSQLLARTRNRLLQFYTAEQLVKGVAELMETPI